MMVTESEIDIREELADMLEAQAGDINFRSDVPAGTVLGEAEVDGQKIQFTQGDSMVRMNGRSLPARTRVYDTRTGITSMVPTAQLTYQLGKRRPDGSRVYSLRLPEGIVKPTPIEDTCQICYVNRGNKHRNFYSENALLTHYQMFHTLEWNAMERDRDIKERREDANRLERLITGLVTALRPDVTANITPEVKEQIAQLQDVAAGLSTDLICDVCGKPAKSAFGLQAHKRSHTS